MRLAEGSSKVKLLKSVHVWAYCRCNDENNIGRFSVPDSWQFVDWRPCLHCRQVSRAVGEFLPVQVYIGSVRTVQQVKFITSFRRRAGHVALV